ncbi:MAG: hypothetical protein WD077_07850 [Bacteroidia bacterium]
MVIGDEWRMGWMRASIFWYNRLQPNSYTAFPAFSPRELKVLRITFEANPATIAVITNYV